MIKASPESRYYSVLPFCSRRMSGAVSFDVDKYGYSIHRRSVLADTQCLLLWACARDHRVSPRRLTSDPPPQSGTGGSLPFVPDNFTPSTSAAMPSPSPVTSDTVQQIIQTNRISIGSNTSPSNGRFTRPSRLLMETTNRQFHATTPPPFASSLLNSVSMEAVCCLAAVILGLEVGIVRRAMEGTRRTFN